MPLKTWERDGKSLTVAASGVVRLDGRQIGKVARISASMFGAWVGTARQQVGVPMRPPPSTLDEAVEGVYGAWLSQEEVRQLARDVASDYSEALDRLASE